MFNPGIVTGVTHERVAAVYVGTYPALVELDRVGPDGAATFKLDVITTPTPPVGSLVQSGGGAVSAVVPGRKPGTTPDDLDEYFEAFDTHFDLYPELCKVLGVTPRPDLLIETQSSPQRTTWA